MIAYLYYVLVNNKHANYTSLIGSTNLFQPEESVCDLGFLTPDLLVRLRVLLLLPSGSATSKLCSLLLLLLLVLKLWPI